MDYLKNAIVILILLFLGMCSDRPLTDQDGFVHINGIDTYYKIMGKGKPIFILHGGPGNDSHLTMKQFEELAGEYQLIFYDQRATGKTNGDSDTANHSVGNFVDDLEALRVKFNKNKISIIGGSWGSLLAMNYAIKYPENVDHLALISCLGIDYKFFTKYQENVKMHRTVEDSILLDEIYESKEFQSNYPKAIENFWRVYFKAYFYDATLVDNLTVSVRDTSIVEVKGRYHKLYQYIRIYDLSKDLHKITCPTIIINGDYDNTPLEDVKPIDDIIPNSELVVVENAGHWLWAEAPEKLIPILRKFLKQ